MTGDSDWTTDVDTPLELLTLPASTLDRDKWGLPDDLDLEPIEQNRAYRDYHGGAVRL